MTRLLAACLCAAVGAAAEGGAAAAAAACAGSDTCSALDQDASVEQPQATALLQVAKAEKVHGGSAAAAADEQAAAGKAGKEVPMETFVGLNSSSKDRAAARNASDYQPVMIDVMAAFNRVEEDGHIIAAYMGSKFPQGYNQGMMPYTEHFQGVQRKQNSNVMYLSGAGKTEDQAQLFVAELASREKVGAMNSNVETTYGGSKTAPAGDAIVEVKRFDGEYYHAGGLSSYGDVLAVGAEAGCDASSRILGLCSEASRVYFFDTSNPSHVKQLPYTIDRPDASAGAIALTQEDDGTFLLIAGRTDSAILDFYRSTATSLSSDPGWTLVSTWYKEALIVGVGQSEGFNSYQNLNFVREKSGKLYLFGLFRSWNGLGDDTVDAFTVSSNRFWGGFSIMKVGSKQLTCPSSACNFQAGAGVYVDAPNNLLIYGVNWEPNQSEGVVEITEFRGSSVGQDQGDRSTGATCGWTSGCAASLGPTECYLGSCLCQRNHVLKAGKCVAK